MGEGRDNVQTLLLVIIQALDGWLDSVRASERDG
jgi:hypothetical protein